MFDKAYLDFDHLADQDTRGVWWGSRAKNNLGCQIVENLVVNDGDIIRDQIIRLTGKHRLELRRVEDWVEVDGVRRKMFFLTNNRSWSPRTVCDLYKRRWDIEVFYKQVRQSLKLSNFLGHSANAVRGQVFTALLVYVRLRFHAFLSAWAHSFARLFAVTRSALWVRIDLVALLKAHGTESGHIRKMNAPKQAWFGDFVLQHP